PAVIECLLEGGPQADQRGEAPRRKARNFRVGVISDVVYARDEIEPFHENRPAEKPVRASDVDPVIPGILLERLVAGRRVRLGKETEALERRQHDTRVPDV